MKLSGVLMMAFVVSAVTVMLNRWGHSFVPSFVLSLAASSLSFLFSVRPSATHQKTLKPPPSAVCHWDHEELPSLPSSVYPLSEHAFLEGRLLFIPSGGLTVNLLHWGEISGSGANGCGLFWINPSFWKSLYTRMHLFLFSINPSIPSIHPSIYPSSNRATAPHAISFLSLLFQSPTLLRQNNWPGFNLLSFPATANWKTPLENPPHCQKRPLPSVSLSFLPGKKTSEGTSDILIHGTYRFAPADCYHLFAALFWLWNLCYLASHFVQRVDCQQTWRQRFTTLHWSIANLTCLLCI